MAETEPHTRKLMYERVFTKEFKPTQLELRGHLSAVPFSKFSEFFKRENPKHKNDDEEKKAWLEENKWAQNDLIVYFAFISVLDFQTGVLGLKAMNLFFDKYDTMNHTTEEDMLIIIFQLLQENGIVTKQTFIDKKAFLQKTEGDFLSPKFAGIFDDIINKFPNQMKDPNEFVEFMKKIFESIVDTTCLNPDAAKLFKNIDKDGSGIISKQEFKEYYKVNNTILGYNEAIIDFMFTIIDEDGSGEIELKEFAIFSTAYQANKIDTEPGLFKCMFDMIDKDHSGDIDVNEMKSVVLRYYKGATESQFNTFMKKMDKDNSGEISFDEFLRFFDVQYL